jgi:hypothetical protein
MYLSMEAFYFQSQLGVLPWAYVGVEYAHMVTRGILEFGGTDDGGYAAQFRVVSPWSELGLILWSHALNIPHPQLLTLSPKDWLLKVAARGLVLPDFGTT